MIGLDTNVLVRYVTQDDAGQSAVATELIESLTEDEPGFVSLVVLVETYWVLRSAYKVDRAEAANVILMLTEAEEIVVQERDAVRSALGNLDDPFDLADALIGVLGQLAGCAHTVTFDRRAAALPGMYLLGED